MAANNYHVLFLVGGDSLERDVSFVSGKSMYEALLTLGHTVTVADPGRPEIAPSENADDIFAGTEISATPPKIGADVYGSRKEFMEYMCRFRSIEFDLVFNALHGGVGEDGTLQACLDYLGIPYTGCGAMASALAMNKNLSKILAAAVGVPIIPGIYVETKSLNDPTTLDRIKNEIGYPLVVKPNRQGSSVGVSIVNEPDELPGALSAAAVLDRALIIERFIDGSEITAAVLGDKVLPLLEIRPKQGFYDYRNKYTSGASEYLVPAPIEAQATAAIQSAALRAYKMLGCTVYARVDFRLSKAGEHYYLEVNTLPGMTSNSLVPKAAGAAGIDFPELIDRIIKLSIED
jgi:D-alanine-D-alanine ligase